MASNGAYEAPINAGLLSANEFVELMMQRLTENTWYCTSVNNSPGQAPAGQAFTRHCMLRLAPSLLQCNASEAPKWV